MDELVPKLASALAPLADVRVAWLFGSRARGQARPDSDLDVAVAFPRALDSGGRFRARLEIVGALADALGPLGERADIIDIDEVDAAVAFAALSEGCLVLARSEDERVEAAVRIMRRNADDLPRRLLFREAARRVALEMGQRR
jgi:predicted nucleotidyltransferase